MIIRLAIVGLLVLSACGDTAVCGNGVIESGEQCDDANTTGGDACSPECKALKTVDTFIVFTPFIAKQFPGFTGESCSGLEVTTVEVTLSGPRAVTERIDCNLNQWKVSSLPDGTYTATARALDRQGTAVSRGMATTTFIVAGQTQSVTIDWPYEDFTKTYNGTWFFHTSWGGEKVCASALPPVTKQRLRLERNGQVVAGMVMTGEPLDGSAAGACHNGNESLAQAAVGIAWGPAKLTLTGEDDVGTALYRKTFDTFVGAGIVNNPITYDAPSLAPDAGPADAASPDGNL